jgi:ubiquinone/menaquinone biosynthesis C-methylase UbiE
MSEQQITFNDGAGYEKMMGVWSRLAGDIFLNWVAPPKSLNWIDVGCGNGAFTELLIERCAPVSVLGIDPSPAQLTFARQRHKAGVAEFHEGDAMALPFADDRFDAAVMALVIFFVPDPAKGLAEMMRVVRPGGVIAAYAWDILNGGFPLDPIQTELRALGISPLLPPSVAVSPMAALEALWRAGGLENVTSREITVERTFENFEDFWATAQLGASVVQTISGLAPDLRELLKKRVSERLPPDASGRVTTGARANAVKGRVKA